MMFWQSRQSIKSLVMCPGAVLNHIIIPHELRQVHVLLWGLDDLSQQLFEAPVIDDNGERVAQ